MDVPFCSQRGLVHTDDTALLPEPGARWSDRTCAIACLTMVLNYYGHVVSMVDVLTAALERKAFDPVRGWLHSGLIEVLQSFGLTAYRRNWRLLDGRESAYLAGRDPTATARREIQLVKDQMLAEGLRTIRLLLAAGLPVVVSIHRPWRDRSSVGHQVVLVGLDADRVTYHDPAERAGAFLRHGRADFFESWKGTAIVAGLSPSRG
ncbi:C39 family peptidase [Actinophytocola sp.]|uniref:C39 family peptidase n=1 Tax=Actinophytocola sp. TaxID=1872138 RepID=UPI0025BEDC57|nr:C39 family peptidase [Actinophytocola sp.]